MNTRPRLRDTVKRLDSALAMIRQDRWQLAGLRSGRLVVLAQGPAPARALTPAQRKVQDWGNGAVEMHGDGFGLIGMRERAAGIGGRVEVVATPGRGTVVTLFGPQI